MSTKHREHRGGPYDRKARDDDAGSDDSGTTLIMGGGAANSAAHGEDGLVQATETASTFTATRFEGVWWPASVYLSKKGVDSIPADKILEYNGEVGIVLCESAGMAVGCVRMETVEVQKATTVTVPPS